MFTAPWAGRDTAGSDSTVTHQIQARDSFPSRFLQPEMGQDLIFLMTPLSHTSLAATAPALRLQDSLPVKSQHHISSPHDFSAPLGTTSPSRTLTQPPVLFPSTKPSWALKTRIYEFIPTGDALCLEKTGNYCKELNQGMHLTLGRKNKHRTTHCEIPLKREGKQPKKLSFTFMQGRCKIISSKLPAVSVLAVSMEPRH